MWLLPLFSRSLSFAEEFNLKILDNGVNDVRIIGSVALAVMIFICAVGMEWEIKAQNFLLAIIVAAIINFIVGSIIGPNTPKERAEGFVGFNCMYGFTANALVVDKWPTVD